MVDLLIFAAYVVIGFFVARRMVLFVATEGGTEEPDSDAFTVACLGFMVFASLFSGQLFLSVGSS